MVRYARGINTGKNDDLITGSHYEGPKGRDKSSKPSVNTFPTNTPLILPPQRTVNQELNRKENQTYTTIPDQVLTEYKSKISLMQNALGRLPSKTTVSQEALECAAQIRNLSISPMNITERKGIAEEANKFIEEINQDQTIGYASEKALLYLTAQTVLLKLRQPNKTFETTNKSLAQRVADDLKNEKHLLKLNSLTWLTDKDKPVDELRVSLSRFSTFLEIVLSTARACSTPTAKKRILEIFSKGFRIDDKNVQQISTRLSELVRDELITPREANQLRISLAESLYVSRGKGIALALLPSFTGIDSKRVMQSFAETWQD